MAVVFSVVVAGGVADFTPTVRLELRTAVATQASVTLSAVTLDVTSVTRLRELTESRLLELRRELQGSSVELTFTIAVETAAAAAAAMNALSPQFADATTASTFLTTTSYSATVLTITSLPAAAYPPPSPPPSPPQEEISIASLQWSSDATMRVGIIIGWVSLGVVVLLLTCYCVNYFPPYAVNKVAPDQAVAGNVRSTLTQTTISNVKRPAVGLGQQGRRVGQQGRLVFVGSRIVPGVAPGVARAAPRAIPSAEPASVPVAVSAAIPGDWPPPTSYSRKGAVPPRGLYDHSQIIVPAGVTAGQVFVVGGKHYVALPRDRARVSPYVGRLPPIITTRWDGPTQDVEPDGHILHRRRLSPISTPYWHDTPPVVLP